MLRNKNLIPLSHQHQRALALCVRIERASPIRESDLQAWQAEIAHLFQSEIEIHFAAEERVLFPVARAYPELIPLVEELNLEHSDLRERFAAAVAGHVSAEEATTLSRRLSAHIRKEERQLFERLQKLMDEPELAALGRELDEALRDASQSCALPTEATRLRAAK
jgi:iron-sulfur cluster repair protein YtfE (RIC family)